MQDPSLLSYNDWPCQLLLQPLSGAQDACLSAHGTPSPPECTPAPNGASQQAPLNAFPPVSLVHLSCLFVGYEESSQLPAMHRSVQVMLVKLCWARQGAIPGTSPLYLSELTQVCIHSEITMHTVAVCPSLLMLYVGPFNVPSGYNVVFNWLCTWNH